jgi:uncharacterized membrane protein (Fun14 family)
MMEDGLQDFHSGGDHLAAGWAGRAFGRLFLFLVGTFLQEWRSGGTALRYGRLKLDILFLFLLAFLVGFFLFVEVLVALFVLFLQTLLFFLLLWRGLESAGVGLRLPWLGRLLRAAWWG